MRNILFLLILLTSAFSLKAMQTLDLGTLTLSQSNQVPIIKNCIKKDNQIEVELDGSVCDDLTIEVVPGTLTSTSSPIIKDVESLKETIELPTTNDNLYYIRLLQNSQLVDSKTLLKQ